jgi:hypothetical protein
MKQAKRHSWVLLGWLVKGFGVGPGVGHSIRWNRVREGGKCREGFVRPGNCCPRSVLTCGNRQHPVPAVLRVVRALLRLGAGRRQVGQLRLRLRPGVPDERPARLGSELPAEKEPEEKPAPRPHWLHRGREGVPGAALSRPG